MIDFPSSTISFHTLIKDYLEDSQKNVTYATYQKKEVVIEKIIIPNTKDKNISMISEIDCRNFKNYVDSLDYSTEYKNYILRTYKAIFKHAEIYYSLGKNPCYVIESFKPTYEEKIRKKEKEELRVWTDEEFKRFIIYVNKEHYKLFFITLFYTGLRLGEAQALQWKDLKRGKLYINKSLTSKTKTNSFEIKEPKTVSSIRQVVIGNTLNELLLNYKQKQKAISGFSENWFIFGNIAPLPSTSITREKDRAIKKVPDLNRITIHDFRHSHASNLISAGMNIVAVSKRLGHENVDMTLRVYTHLIRDNEEEVTCFIEKTSQNLLKEINK